MKTLMTALLVIAPAAAQAMGMHDGKPGSGSGAGIHQVVGFYAVIAALGYWILTHSAKETANYLKKTGHALGWALIVISLLGVLCGVFFRVREMYRSNTICPGVDMMQPG